MNVLNPLANSQETTDPPSNTKAECHKQRGVGHGSSLGRAD